MRKQYSKEIEAKLLVDSRNTCNICWRRKDVQIHHINEDSSDSSEENLIVICLDCHSQVHTHKGLAKNYSQETLRLYKTTWLDLVRKYPFENDLIDEKNDIKIIRFVLEQGDRRALYFPFHLEIPYSMFRSISDYRQNIQKSGYRLLNYTPAKESVQAIYKSLVEIEFLFPVDRKHFEDCFPGMMGAEKLQFLELKRQEIIYHLNKLGKLIGFKDNVMDGAEFKKIGFEINTNRRKKMTCFGNFQKDCKQCDKCDYNHECLTETINNAT
jgi:hypothetical protein